MEIGLAQVLLPDQVAYVHSAGLGAMAFSALRMDSLMESGCVVKGEKIVFAFF